MIDLLKKDSFIWSKKDLESFLAIKKALTTAPVLCYLDFTKTFVVETNACGMGIGVVLMQKGCPIAL